MTKVADIVEWMNQQAPLSLSESWDNTGLLLGDSSAVVTRVQTCLTLTSESVDEAIEGQANLVIVHHPMPFKPLSRMTTDSETGRLLWKLATHRISVYSPHTAWDSAANGINAMIAQRLGLVNVSPIASSLIPGLERLGAGRIGDLDAAQSLQHLCKLVREALPNCRLRGVDQNRPVLRIAVACGSGASLLSSAVKRGCDLFLTGEATYHHCLEAQAAGVSLLLVGHFASEQFAMAELSQRLAADFAKLQCWASRKEQDPVKDFQLF